MENMPVLRPIPTINVMAMAPDFRFSVEVGNNVLVHEGVPAGECRSLAGSGVTLVEALSGRGPFPPESGETGRVLSQGLATVFEQGL